MLELAVKSTLEQCAPFAGHVYTAEALRDDEHAFAFYRILTVREQTELDGFSGLYEATVEIHAVAGSQSAVVEAAEVLETQVKAMLGTEISGLRIEQIELEQRSPDIKEVLVNKYRRMFLLTVQYQKL